MLVRDDAQVLMQYIEEAENIRMKYCDYTN